MAPVAFDLLNNFLQYKQMYEGDQPMMDAINEMETALADLKTQMTAKNADGITACLVTIRVELQSCVDKMMANDGAFLDDAQVCLEAFNQLSAQDAMTQ